MLTVVTNDRNSYLSFIGGNLMNFQVAERTATAFPHRADRFTQRRYLYFGRKAPYSIEPLFSISILKFCSDLCYNGKQMKDIMAQTALKDSIDKLVQEYIDNWDLYDSNPQIRVNPEMKTATLVDGSDMQEEIEDSDEAIENAAGAQGAETEDADDYQVMQNPDFYPVKTLLTTNNKGEVEVNEKEVEKIASLY